MEKKGERREHSQYEWSRINEKSNMVHKLKYLNTLLDWIWMYMFGIRLMNIIAFDIANWKLWCRMHKNHYFTVQFSPFSLSPFYCLLSLSLSLSSYPRIDFWQCTFLCSYFFTFNPSTCYLIRLAKYACKTVRKPKPHFVFFV